MAARLTPPEDTVRRYLVGHGGRVTVPLRSLLTTWQVRDPTPAERQRIVADLGAVGVRLDRALVDLTPNEPATLSVATETRGDAAQTQQPGGGGVRLRPKWGIAAAVVVAAAAGGALAYNEFS